MGKARINQSGFSAVEVVLVIVIAALVGVAGLIVYSGHHKKSTPAAKAGSTAASQPAKSTNTTPQGTLVKIPELGVQFTLPVNTLAGFKYVATNVNYNQPGNNTLGTYPTAYLGTKQLDTLGCPATGVMGNAPPLGFLTKTTGQYPANATVDNTTGTLLKQYPDFYLSYRSRGFACFDDDDAKNQIVTTDNQQLQDALKSLELIK